MSDGHETHEGALTLCSTGRLTVAFMLDTSSFVGVVSVESFARPVQEEA